MVRINTSKIITYRTCAKGSHAMMPYLFGVNLEPGIYDTDIGGANFFELFFQSKIFFGGGAQTYIFQFHNIFGEGCANLQGGYGNNKASRQHDI